MSVETLTGVETGGGWGAQEIKIGLMPPRVQKVSIFPLFLNLQGGLLWKASVPSKFCFFVLEMKKESTMTFLQEDCFKQNYS